MPDRSTTTAILTCAAIGGIIAGIGSASTEPPARAILVDAAHRVAVTTGIRRAREPRPGDRWGGCNDARIAGTAPIYRDEPGYRVDMDGDGDGIACEPVRR